MKQIYAVTGQVMRTARNNACDRNDTSSIKEEYALDVRVSDTAGFNFETDKQNQKNLTLF